jgi:hypothetical protein
MWSVGLFFPWCVAIRKLVLSERCYHAGLTPGQSPGQRVVRPFFFFVYPLVALIGVSRFQSPMPNLGYIGGRIITIIITIF